MDNGQWRLEIGCKSTAEGVIFLLLHYIIVASKDKKVRLQLFYDFDSSDSKVHTGVTVT